MELQLIKYRDIGMATYTYFWKNEHGQMASPFFDSEADAMAWTNEKPDPKVLDDEKAFDEAWAELEKKQTWKIVND